MINGVRSSSASLDELQLYEWMLRIRRVEEMLLRLSADGKIDGSVHPCLGQESVPVGVVSALRPSDKVVATYRGHGWALSCGVQPVALIGECLGRAGGTNGGRGGSAYLSSPSVGFLGESSIVGAGLPIADGIALAMKRRAHGDVAVVSFGDGATNQGAAHEALVFGVAQQLPVIFVCENNGWSEMTPIRTTVPGVALYQRAAGYGLPSELVDGSNVLDVIDAASRAIARARSGGGPTFLEVSVPRLGGHYNRDVEHYRPEEDRARARESDPVARLRNKLLNGGGRSAQSIIEVETRVEQEVVLAAREAEDSPMAKDSPDQVRVVAESGGRSRIGSPTAGRSIPYWRAVNLALGDELETRSNLMLFGEDVAEPGGVFGVTRGLKKRFGERVLDTPISESAILGAAVGACLAGMLPVVEIMWADFTFVAFDQLLNQASNVRYLSRDALSCPLVVRTQQGATPGACAQHTQSLEAIFCHVPGLKVGMPSNPQDAYSMLRAAVADPDPVIFIESRALYQVEGPVDIEAEAEPLGGARQLRDGGDVAIISWGPMVGPSMSAARDLSNLGVEAAVLDLRWLVPLDLDALLATVQQAGRRAVIAHQANLRGGFGAEVVARLTEQAGEPVQLARVGAPNVRLPAAASLQDELLPSSRDIVAAGLAVTRS